MSIIIAMQRVFLVLLGIAAVVIGGVLVLRNRAQVTPTATAGTESAADALEIIEARRVLMRRTEDLMKPLDALTVEETGDLPALHSAAASIEAMMLAFPHLFPPATNLYEANVRESPTTALPGIWDDLPAFRTLAAEAEGAAATIVQTGDMETIRTAGRALRASCDGCHARFMKAYTPPRVTQEDLDFDFDPVFKGK
jgi:cytochrome c556